VGGGTILVSLPGAPHSALGRDSQLPLGQIWRHERAAAGWLLEQRRATDQQYGGVGQKIEKPGEGRMCVGM